MRSSITLSIIGGGLIVQALLFYTFASPLTLQIFPGASDEALHVGSVMRRGLAAVAFLAGLVIFLVRGDGHRTTKRFLFGCGIGFAAISLSMAKIMIDKSAVIPLPAITLYGIIAVLSIYLAVRKDR